MKNFYHIVFFICAHVVSGQEPPVYIAFETGKMDIGINEFLRKYEIGALYFEGKIRKKNVTDFVKGDKTIIENTAYSILKKYEHTYLDTYIFQPVVIKIEKGNIFSFHVHERKTSNTMSIFIRTQKEMSFGDIVFLENFIFYPGTYFIDLCRLKKEREQKRNIRVQTIKDFDFELKINLSNIQKHKIKIRKLNKLLKKDSCKQYIK